MPVLGVLSLSCIGSWPEFLLFCAARLNVLSALPPSLLGMPRCQFRTVRRRYVHTLL